MDKTLAKPLRRKGRADSCVLLDVLTEDRDCFHAGSRVCAVLEGIMVAEEVGCTDSPVSIPLSLSSDSFMRSFPPSFPLPAFHSAVGNIRQKVRKGQFDIRSDLDHLLPPIPTADTPTAPQPHANCNVQA